MASAFISTFISSPIYMVEQNVSILVLNVSMDVSFDPFNGKNGLSFVYLPINILDSVVLPVPQFP